jgi:lactate dehydrogenase-like 2-hydroxyacid dehydrogenase
MRERTPFPRELLQQLPNLKLLLTTGTQFETFDLTAAKELGITVAAAPGKGRTDDKKGNRPVRPKIDIKKGGNHPTTQHTWALILALARNVANDDAVMKDPTMNGWQTQLAKGLTGATLGVVGLGRLGAAVARIGALAWGMNVICWSEHLTQQKANQKAEEIDLPSVGGGVDRDASTFRVVSKEELFRSADVVSLHYVLSDRSRGLVGAKELGMMKNAALLVNTSRGPLIDDQALYEVLQKGGIGGAALDVFEIKPLPATSPWRSQEWGRDGRSNLLITPHMGYTEEGLMHTWYEETAENVERWLDGREILNQIY